MATSTATEIILKKFTAARNPELRDELIMTHAPLVRLVIGRLGRTPTGIIEQDDLIDSGTIGLINAIDQYDPATVADFEVFATTHIRDTVFDQLRSLGWNQHLAKARLRQIEDALGQLEPRLGRPATEEEIAAKLNVSVDHYRRMLRDASLLISLLDTPLSPLPNA